jgi:hypothetical protein
MKSIIFWDMVQCSAESACRLLACWFAEPISSTLQMEAICSSETSVETQWTTWRHIAEDDTLHIFTYSTTLVHYLNIALTVQDL